MAADQTIDFQIGGIQTTHDQFFKSIGTFSFLIPNASDGNYWTRHPQPTFDTVQKFYLPPLVLRNMDTLWPVGFKQIIRHEEMQYTMQLLLLHIGMLKHIIV